MKTSCAPFTNCSAMFNRRETDSPARDSHHCGDCIDGFVEDEYINGERPDKCKSKAEIERKKDNKDNTNTLFYLKTILPILGGLIACGTTVYVLSYWFCWRKFSKFFNGCCTNEDHQCVDNEQPEDQCAANIDMLLPIPSAPRDETNLFEDENNIPNDKKKKTCIETQRATVFVPPSYVNHANYGTNELYHSIDDTSHQEAIPLNTSNGSRSTGISMEGAANTDNNYTNNNNNNNAQYTENTSFDRQNIVVSQTNYINLSL
ncbi:putative uncharacterized protein DDB_G0282499 isoform X2 [Pseudomyrmex gracilis]|nr:putative uncharacterized protein DDB_G0282499 isoform X2 [Pseudomyrmex gracilis]XP_020289710.1 putative uncharacterized protein DDB_G0282499 isoform X2 [Pseudomyrmex gracilis]XP_020289711.1 putative uncharacterized protein DDB_G0282499 isoform X2 [Pseudomyrmex gracilis]